MAFDQKNLSYLSYANGFTLWHYRTEDAARDVHEDCFMDARDMMRFGDMIMVNFSDVDGIFAVQADWTIKRIGITEA
jgi:uncharacterized heparinase superfamily protein